MKSIQSVSIWKMLISFVVIVTLAPQSEATEIDCLDQDSKKVALRNISLMPCNRISKYRLETIYEDEREYYDLTSNKIGSTNSYNALIAWIPLFSLPFAKDINALTKAFLSSPPSLENTFCRFYENFHNPAMHLKTLKVLASLLISFKVASFLGKSIYSKILKCEDYKDRNFPVFVKNLIFAVRSNHKKCMFTNLSCLEITYPFYKLSLGLLAIGALAKYFKYGFWAKTINLSALLFSQYPLIRLAENGV